MRLASAFSLFILLAACAPPAPRVPADADAPAAADLSSDVASPVSLPLKPGDAWCYEVGNAPAGIVPACKPTPNDCEVALALVRRHALMDGITDTFSECRAMRSDDMTRPRRLSGNMPVYSAEAREAKVQGTLVARCTITAEGIVKNCKIVASLPPMDAAALDALATWRFEPMRFLGRAVYTTYTVPFRFDPH
jgi:TonB family protein